MNPQNWLNKRSSHPGMFWLGQYAGRMMAKPSEAPRIKRELKIPSGIMNIPEFLANVASLCGNPEGEDYRKGVHSGIRIQLNLGHIETLDIGYLKTLIKRREINILELMSKPLLELFQTGMDA